MCAEEPARDRKELLYLLIRECGGIEIVSEHLGLTPQLIIDALGLSPLPQWLVIRLHQLYGLLVPIWFDTPWEWEYPNEYVQCKRRKKRVARDICYRNYTEAFCREALSAYNPCWLCPQGEKERQMRKAAAPLVDEELFNLFLEWYHAKDYPGRS